MKTRTKILIGIAIGVIAALNSPSLIKQTSNNCAALERQAMSDVAAKDKEPPLHNLRAFVAFSDGRMAAVTMNELYPHIPTQLSCAAVYYQIIGPPH